MALFAGIGPDGQPKVPSVTAAGELAIADGNTVIAASRIELLILRELRRITLLLALSQGVPAAALENEPEFEGLTIG